MLRIIIIIIFFTVSQGFCQNSPEISNEKLPRLIGYGSCEDGTEQASIDFENGRMNSYSYGLVFYKDLKFATFYKEHMKNKYNIEVGNRGCVITRENNCYSKKMKELILNEYGADFFDRTRKEAQELFDKTD